MRRADVSVHVDHRRPPCVLEPALVLAHAGGPSLAMRLVAVFEPWLTRSFWQALDNSELLIGPHARAGQPVSAQALSRWIALRERTDESGWVLRWVGDRIAESQFGDLEDLSLFDRFEHLQASLDQRAERLGLDACEDDGLNGRGALAPHRSGAGSGATARTRAWRGFDLTRAGLDALSLSAALEGALVLCACSRDGEPQPVAQARRLGLTVRDTGAADAQASLFPAERQVLREALARAGLAPLTLAMPPLAAVHVWLDDCGADASTPEGGANGRHRNNVDRDVDSDRNDGDGDGDDAIDPWSPASVWWYRL